MKYIVNDMGTVNMGSVATYVAVLTAFLISLCMVVGV